MTEEEHALTISKREPIKSLIAAEKSGYQRKKRKVDFLPPEEALLKVRSNVGHDKMSIKEAMIKIIDLAKETGDAIEKITFDNDCRVKNVSVIINYNVTICLWWYNLQANSIFKKVIEEVGSEKTRQAGIAKTGAMNHDQVPSTSDEPEPSTSKAAVIDEPETSTRKDRNTVSLRAILCGRREQFRSEKISDNSDDDNLPVFSDDDDGESSDKRIFDKVITNIKKKIRNVNNKVNFFIKLHYLLIIVHVI